MQTMARASVRMLLPLLLVAAVGCGPAHRFRSPDILPKGDVEVGGAIGLAVDTTAAEAGANNPFGGAEVQAWLRGSPSNYVEVGGRFWTHSFNTYGGAFELRIAPVRRPVAFSIDLGLLAGACCAARGPHADADNEFNNLAAGGGFDVGVTIGARIGGDAGPAPYFSPHFQKVWTFPPDPGFPMLLLFPVGVDIPLGTTVLHLRPEFLVSVLIYEEIDPQVRLGGGVAFAIQGPGFEKLREQQRAKKAAENGGR